MSDAAPQLLKILAMDDRMRIRRARVDDAHSLAVLALQVWLDTYALQGVRRKIADYVLAVFTPEKMAHTVADPHKLVLVVEQDDHLLGFAQVALHRNIEHCELVQQAELERLYIQEPFCCAGLGKHLLTETESQLTATGVDALWLNMWVHNLRAGRFYTRMAYADVGATWFEMEGEKHENRIFLKLLAR